MRPYGGPAKGKPSPEGRVHGAPRAGRTVCGLYWGLAILDRDTPGPLLRRKPQPKVFLCKFGRQEGALGGHSRRRVLMFGFGRSTVFGDVAKLANATGTWRGALAVEILQGRPFGPSRKAGGTHFRPRAIFPGRPRSLVDVFIHPLIGDVQNGGPEGGPSARGARGGGLNFLRDTVSEIRRESGWAAKFPIRQSPPGLAAAIFGGVIPTKKTATCKKVQAGLQGRSEILSRTASGHHEANGAERSRLCVEVLRGRPRGDIISRLAGNRPRPTARCASDGFSRYPTNPDPPTCKWSRDLGARGALKSYPGPTASPSETGWRNPDLPSEDCSALLGVIQTISGT